MKVTTARLFGRKGGLIFLALFGIENARALRYVGRKKSAREHVVEPERVQLASHSRDSDAIPGCPPPG